MEKIYCNVCGAELEENSEFCKECGEIISDSNPDMESYNSHAEAEIQTEIRVEEIGPVEDTTSLLKPATQLKKKNDTPYQTVQIPTSNEVNVNKNDSFAQKNQSPIKIVLIIILVIAFLGGIVYGAIWVYGEFFSKNTPPIYPNEMNNIPNTSQTNRSVANNVSNTSKENRIYDTKAIDGMTKLKYQMSDIVGTWYVTFRNYVLLEGEVIGVYQSYSHVTFEKIDDINFSATFDVQTAEISGETVDVGEQIFYGKLENDIIIIQMDCEDDFLYTGMPYNIEFTPEVKNGKLSGINENISDKFLEGHNMTYRVVTEFVQE